MDENNAQHMTLLVGVTAHHLIRRYVFEGLLMEQYTYERIGTAQISANRIT
jgi:hypothetical protein